MELCQSMFKVMSMVIVIRFQNYEENTKYVPGKTMKNLSTLFNQIWHSLRKYTRLEEMEIRRCRKIIPFYLLLGMLFEFNVIYSKERGYQCKKRPILKGSRL